MDIWFEQELTHHCYRKIQTNYGIAIQIQRGKTQRDPQIIITGHFRSFFEGRIGMTH